MYLARYVLKLNSLLARCHDCSRGYYNSIDGTRLVNSSNYSCVPIISLEIIY